MKVKYSKILTSIFFVAAITSCQPERPQQQSDVVSPPEFPQQIGGEQTWTAPQLLKAFNGNVISAKNEFGGKSLIVVGKVNKVDQLGSSPIIQLKGDFVSVLDCFFSASDTAALSKIVPGQKIAIRGVCKPSQDSSWFKIADCSIVKLID